MKPRLFQITQDAILKNQKGEILILKHRKGKWPLPGGRINLKENWFEALKREIKEEQELLILKSAKY